MGAKGVSHLTTPIERFNTKYKINPETWCWEWQFGRDKDGYGRFWVKDSHYQRASQWSYIFYIGEIPKGMNVCHACDNPCCCNPFHLFLGTPKENTNDSMSKGRRPTTPHPSKRSYDLGCRCDGCKEIYLAHNRAYIKRWREENPEKYKQQKLHIVECARKRRELKKSA